MNPLVYAVYDGGFIHFLKFPDALNRAMIKGTSIYELVGEMDGEQGFLLYEEVHSKLDHVLKF